MEGDHTPTGRKTKEKSGGQIKWLSTSCSTGVSLVFNSSGPSFCQGGCWPPGSAPSAITGMACITGKGGNRGDRTPSRQQQHCHDWLIKNKPTSHPSNPPAQSKEGVQQGRLKSSGDGGHEGIRPQEMCESDSEEKVHKQRDKVKI